MLVSFVAECGSLRGGNVLIIWRPERCNLLIHWINRHTWGKVRLDSLKILVSWAINLMVSVVHWAKETFNLNCFEQSFALKAASQCSSASQNIKSPTLEAWAKMFTMKIGLKIAKEKKAYWIDQIKRRHVFDVPSHKGSVPSICYLNINAPHQTIALTAFLLSQYSLDLCGFPRDGKLKVCHFSRTRNNLYIPPIKRIPSTSIAPFKM